MMQGAQTVFAVSAKSVPQPLFFLHETNDVGGELTFKEPASSEIGSKRQALVVDDVADVTELLSVLLEHAGYDVVTANSGPAALTAARRHQFDVIISDIGMPGMNGYELARTLRDEPGYAMVPIVAVTGYSMYDRKRSLDAGFNAHITKPIEPRALLDLIEHL